MLLKKIYILLVFLVPGITLAGLPHKNSSVLASGRWYKLVVASTGIYRISYNDLTSMGIDPATVNTASIRLYGNGSGMLPEVNNSLRIDDLREIAIQVEDGGDGQFGPSDYILFYGEGADKWNYQRLTHYFTHQRNLYSDSTYYFLNFDQGPGKRVQPLQTLSLSNNRTSVRFDDFRLHELDQLNLVKSGKEWYGEFFDNTRNTWVIPFNIPYIDSTVPVRLRSDAAANAATPSYFYIYQIGKKLDSLRIDSTDPLDFYRAGNPQNKQTIIPDPGPDQTITLSYHLPYPNSKGWLNYIELNCSRNLVWVAPQMSFRDVNVVGPGQITEFTMKNANPSIKVWDVTNPSNTGLFETTLNNSILKFKQSTDTLREFIAFDGSFYLPVKFAGEVPNQNLHANEPSTLVIVTNPLFTEQAERLAVFHRQHNGITVQVVKTLQVFNEFACGQGDPTAIRDYIKLLYDKSQTDSVKYLLLFGDGSYDPKDRIPGNKNMIPTFQSSESLTSMASYVTDDYFGIMSDNSGQESNGVINIGIGRFPVSDTVQARIMVDKIIHYSYGNYPVRSAWRNMLTFVADDQDNNLHLKQAEELTADVEKNYPSFNLNKIYFDSYKMVDIPGGERFPDATRAIDDAVKKGSLIINYTGHGGETGWSSEQALSIADIQAWTNYDKLPVFVTATCEFSRFDNPERFTAGEMVILQPNGGAIALYSTTRLAYASYNILLNASFIQHLMDKSYDGHYVKMGDLIRFSKNDNNNINPLRNFVLLADPAQSIAFANYKVRTLTINDKPAIHPDTTKGMSTVTVKGIVEDDAGQQLTAFSGVVNCKVFDKPVTNTTLANRPGANGSFPENFKTQTSLLFSGDFPVTSGAFKVSFIVPKSIALQFGNGKLSYYAYNADTDATGYSDQIVIGGRDNTVIPGNNGPEISMYLDTHDFISGGTTGSAPILFADLFDTNGINCVGLGIGHEIEAVLDNDRAHSMILNDYFASVFNSYTRGSITYPLDGLASGFHTLSLKAWDMFDNSSEKEITFYVSVPSGFTMKNVITAPNPMTDHTDFCFQPRFPVNGGLTVQIHIYNLNGINVQNLNAGYPDPQSEGQQNKISWDGTDTYGNKLRTGLYPYKIIFLGSDGSISETSQKLMIIR